MALDREQNLVTTPKRLQPNIPQRETTGKEDSGGGGCKPCTLSQLNLSSVTSVMNSLSTCSKEHLYRNMS